MAHHNYRILLLSGFTLIASCGRTQNSSAALQVSKTVQECAYSEDPQACYIESCSCMHSDGGTPDAEDSGCWVTGIGHMGDAASMGGAGKNNQDSFGGNAKGTKDGTVQGQWQNTTHDGHLFHGEPSWLKCWKDDGAGPDVPKADANNAEWGGSGSFDHVDGYTFKAKAQDRGEPGKQDTYSIVVYDADGKVVYEEQLSTIAGGNFQIHPPTNGHPYNPATAAP